MFHLAGSYLRLVFMRLDIRWKVYMRYCYCCGGPVSNVAMERSEDIPRHVSRYLPTEKANSAYKQCNQIFFATTTLFANPN